MYKPLIQLVSASFFAQIISFGIMPIITRLHTPDSLGKYQYFTTLSLVLIPFVSGSLAFAIKSSTSNYRAVVNLKLAMQYSLISIIILFLIFPLLAFLLLKSKIDWFVPYIPLLFIFVYLSANFQYAMAFLTNNREYGDQSTYTVTKSLISNLFKLIFTFISKSGFSLVWALVVTEVFQILRVLRFNYKKFFLLLIKFDFNNFKRNLVKSKVYPTYVSMASVLGILMNWFPILVTGFFYGPKYAGLLGLAFMVVNTPIYPFISALQNVCFGELAREKNIDKLILVYKKSIIIALVPSIIGLFVLGKYGEDLFAIVFGEKWRIAGVYAFICFIPISLSFVFSPVYSTLNHFFSFQKIFFWINGITLIIGASITSYIGSNSLDFELFLYAFALTMGFGHVTLFSISVFLAARKAVIRN